MVVRARYNVLGICAGVGGLELGIRIAEPGTRGICYVEREAFAAANLVARMEDRWLHPAPVWSDLGTFDPRPWRGLVHCVVSGDPCQPNSVAGRGLGAADDRWLIDQVLRIVDCLRPDRFFRENVPGNADGQLAVLVPALEGMGFRVAAGIFSAAEVGASHRRERLFVMADRQGMLGQALKRREPDRIGQCVADTHGRDQRPRSRGRGQARQPRLEERHHADGCGREVADAGSDALRLQPERDMQGQALGQYAEPGSAGAAVAHTSGTRLQGRERPGTLGSRDRPEALGPTPEFRLPLFAPGPSDPDWQRILEIAPHLEPAIRRLPHGLPGRVDQLRAYGNAVVPLAAAYAWVTLGAALAADLDPEATLIVVTE